MTQYKKYSFILAVALINIGCTTPSSTGQLTPSCQSACAQYSNNDQLSALCQNVCMGKYNDDSCCNFCTNDICYYQDCLKSPDSGTGLTCAEIFPACNIGCLNAAQPETCTRTSCN